MKKLLFLITTIVVLSSCKKNVSTDPVVSQFTLQSKIEKGPFVKGTSINFFEVDQNLSQTGKQFAATVLDDLGSFELTGQIDANNYLLTKADGYFYNESTGKLSNSRIILSALSRPQNGSKNNMNVNLLTHLERDRVEALMKGINSGNNSNSKKTFDLSKQQSINEILSFFNISPTNNTAEQLQLFSSDGELFFISSVFLNNKSDAQYTDLMTAFSQDLADNGVINNQTTINALLENTMLLDTLSIRNNAISYFSSKGYKVNVPNISKLISSFINKYNSAHVTSSGLSFYNIYNGSQLNLISDTETALILNRNGNVNYNCPTSTTNSSVNAVSSIVVNFNGSTNTQTFDLRGGNMLLKFNVTSDKNILPVIKFKCNNGDINMLEYSSGNSSFGKLTVALGMNKGLDANECSVFNENNVELKYPGTTTTIGILYPATLSNSFNFVINFMDILVSIPEQRVFTIEVYKSKFDITPTKSYTVTFNK